MVITFDFDDTLRLTQAERDPEDPGGPPEGVIYTDEPNPKIFPKFVAALRRGDTVHIVTSRSWNEDREKEMKAWLGSQKEMEKLPIPKIHFTGGELKRDKLLELGAQVHYDDDDAEGEALAGTPIRWIRAPLHRSWRPPGEDDADRDKGRYLAEGLIRRWVRALVQSSP